MQMGQSTFSQIAGCMDYQQLEKRLNKRGYRQSKLVTGLWKQNWRPVQLTIVEDNFGFNYVGKGHALHLKQTI